MSNKNTGLESNRDGLVKYGRAFSPHERKMGWSVYVSIVSRYFNENFSELQIFINFNTLWKIVSPMAKIIFMLDSIQQPRLGG